MAGEARSEARIASETNESEASSASAIAGHASMTAMGACSARSNAWANWSSKHAQATPMRARQRTASRTNAHKGIRPRSRSSATERG